MDKNSLLVKAITSYDRSYDQMTDLYDNMDYSRNIAFCNYTPHVFTTGNIIKFYQYQIGKPQIIQASEEKFEIPAYRLLSGEDETTIEEDLNPAISDEENADIEEVSEEEGTQTSSSSLEGTVAKDEDEIYVIPPLNELDDY